MVPECDHCYAYTQTQVFFGKEFWGAPLHSQRRTMSPTYWKQPLRWNEQARKDGRRHRVFCASMADVFEANPAVVAERERLWELIARTPWLDWLLLTKRPKMVQRLVPWGNDPASWPDNVGIGTSAGSQRTANLFLPYLVTLKAKIIFVSVEPYLEAADLSPWLPKIHWCIFGGESGRGARPMDLEWVRQGIRQCREAGTAVFVKQLGEVYAREHHLRHKKGGDQDEWPEDLRVREYPKLWIKER